MGRAGCVGSPENAAWLSVNIPKWISVLRRTGAPPVRHELIGIAEGWHVHAHATWIDSGTEIGDR